MKIILMSDLHFSPYSRWRDFEDLVAAVKREKPDYIMIAGDMVNGIADFYAPGVQEKVMSILEKLGKIAPVLAVPGNHEYVWMPGDKTEMRDERMMEALSSAPNVKLLENKWFEDENLAAYGMVEPTDVRPKRGKVNFLLAHDPQEAINRGGGWDFTVSGHMHEGMVPRFLQGIWRSDRGLMGPNMTLFPRHARMIRARSKTPKITGVGEHLILPAIETMPVRPRCLQALRWVYSRRFFVLEVNPVEKSYNLVEKIAKN